MKERLYDIDTCHYVDREKQKAWEGKIKEEMWEFYNYFKEKNQQGRRSSDMPRRNSKKMAIKTGV